MPFPPASNPALSLACAQTRRLVRVAARGAWGGELPGGLGCGYGQAPAVLPYLLSFTSWRRSRASAPGWVLVLRRVLDGTIKTGQPHDVTLFHEWVHP